MGDRVRFVGIVLLLVVFVLFCFFWLNLLRDVALGLSANRLISFVCQTGEILAVSWYLGSEKTICVTPPLV